VSGGGALTGGWRKCPNAALGRAQGHGEGVTLAGLRERGQLPTGLNGALGRGYDNTSRGSGRPDRRPQQAHSCRLLRRAQADFTAGECAGDSGARGLNEARSASA